MAAHRHVVTVHDLFPLTHPEWYSTRYAAVHGRLLRQHFRRAAGFVAVSPAVRDELAARLQDDRPIAVAPNAPAAVFRTATEVSTSVPPGAILAVGSLEPRKNLVRLTEAYRTLSAAFRRQHPLLIVGTASRQFQGVALAESEGISLVGYVPDAELAKLYRSAHALIFPSLNEGFGLPIVEAVAAGARRLALSDMPVFRWIAGAGAVYFDPYDVAAIASALRSVGGPEETLGPDAGPKMMARFDWKTSAAAIDALMTAVAMEA
jgi:glycosyltransferase involved in cell wall biosynthesis